MRRSLLASVLAALALVVAGCGDGSSEDGSSSEGDERTEPESGGRARTPVTQPAATDAAAVTPFISELLVAHDEVVNQIIADPSVAEDPSDPLIEEFLGLFELDSDNAEELLGAWAERADEGLSTEPFDEEYPTTSSRLDGEVDPRGDDEVWFPYCSIRRYRVVDGDGNVVQEVPRQDQPGEGVAVRIDGEWRLRELSVVTNAFGCRTEGGG